MIRLKTMEWSNWFSYGDNNSIDFSENTLTQILGTNGSGKSSIPLILEELLYGKNSKGVKKQDITNRYTENKNRDAVLEFSVDKDDYTLKLHRTATTTKLTLIKNGEDISSHTSTGTYKQLEQIIGIDFKTFNQLVYQSSKASLEFLTATDTQRKNFLIALLGLDKYAQIYEVFKTEYRNISKVVSELEGSCKTIEKWINNHEKEDLNPQILLQEVEETEDAWVKEVAKLQHELDNIHSINKARTKNNQYKAMLQQIDMNILSEIVEKPEAIQKVVSERDYLNKKIKETTAKGKQLSSLKAAECPTCHQEVDTDLLSNILNGWREEVKENSLKVAKLDEAIAEHREIDKKWKAHTEATQEFERLTMLIDKNLPIDLVDEDELKRDKDSLQNKIQELVLRRNKVVTHNKKVEDHNARIDMILAQIDQYKKQLTLETQKLMDTQELMTIHDILRQSFSTNGLVSYKIEYMVKDLEEEINSYLSEFSAGIFQIAFTLKGEKLNVEIIDNGNTIDITALSSGELARVNISTLLAIRKMMSNISSTRLNLLFLDEIMGVLDAFGKEKLIEVLLNETDLNTCLVSHEYTHPLLEKVTIVKDGRISRVEYG